MEDVTQLDLAENKNFHEDTGHALDSLNVQRVVLAIFVKKTPAVCPDFYSLLCDTGIYILETNTQPPGSLCRDCTPDV